MIAVSDEDIAYAENILLKNGGRFDLDERVPFIKRFDTVDVHAVPGSGKTTALLAKLLVLERKLPFDDGSGILVISHTNTAIEKIENEIKRHCPKLFAYPNYIGTIQGFVDKYLAVPFYRNEFKKPPSVIDEVAYSISLTKWFRISTSKIKTSNNELFKKLWYIYNAYNPFYNIRFGLRNNEAALLSGLNGGEFHFHKPRKGKNYTDYSAEEKKELSDWAFNLKLAVMKTDGVLHYDDAYFLANCCLSQNPEVIQELQGRFKCVFVDEMQDMEPHQIEILEKLFLKEPAFCYQRIGDINQTIFSNDDFYDGNSWETARRALTRLTGTHRFGGVLANIVEKFGIIHTPIVSKVIHREEPPKLILYKNESISQVLPLFSQIIHNHKTNFPELYHKYPVKAIGWRKASDTGYSLAAYFADFVDFDNVKKQTGASFWHELNEAARNAVEKNGNLYDIQKSIWIAMTRSLKCENYKDYNSLFSYKRFKEFLEFNDREYYEKLNTAIYKLSLNVLENKIEKVHSIVGDFIANKLLVRFGLSCNFSKDYLQKKVAFILEEKNNTYIDMNTGIKIDVATIHAVKGETHAATLYLETYFQNDRGKTQHHYESQRLIDQLKGIQIGSDEKKKRKRQSAKMMYVGLSRPQSLLCLAANEAHFNNEDLAELVKMGWEINKDLLN